MTSTLSAKEVALTKLENPMLADIREKFQERYEEQFGRSKGKGLYSERDWRRIAYSLSKIPEGTKSVLDVGAGPGALINYLTMDDKIEQATAIDIRHYTKFIGLAEDIDLRIMDAADMDFDEDSFDCVICMEVIEHLPDGKMQNAIDELRRVARNRLVMSVPFEEPEPLPSYHLQRFDADRIRKVFPNADYELVGMGQKGVPWLFAIEDF